jgi:prepilin peptidase CpaA
LPRPALTLPSGSVATFGKARGPGVGNMVKDVLLLTIFPGAMAFAAATDLFTMTVPNRLALVLLLGFFAMAPLAGLSWPDLGLHVAVGLAALVLGFVLFTLGWIGGGDAKLFAATCLWLGPDPLLTYAIYTALLGGVLCLAILLWRGLPLPALLTGQNWLVRLHDRKEGVPYGIALALAGLLVYPQTPFMAALGG